MQRRALIAGNWKMNCTIKDTVSFIQELKKYELPSDRDIVICPPFTALSEAHLLLSDTSIMLGAQNMHFEDKGTFTGEISPVMLKELCEYVIIGHSERRYFFRENDILINKKIIAALEHKLIPIFCIGETLEQRNSEKTFEIVSGQLLRGLKSIEELSKIVIAYEPVWAIGTGINATPKQAEEVHAYIRALLEGKYDKESASNLRILYGGSVKPDNIKDLMKEEDIDGVLVGGASLDVEGFYRIIMFDD